MRNLGRMGDIVRKGGWWMLLVTEHFLASDPCGDHGQNGSSKRFTGIALTGLINAKMRLPISLDMLLHPPFLPDDGGIKFPMEIKRRFQLEVHPFLTYLLNSLEKHQRLEKQVILPPLIFPSPDDNVALVVGHASVFTKQEYNPIHTGIKNQYT
ncbi:predicted protein [Histoplasma capsulatum G186AR]|uniref:Uncharacterized protein n=2 Tax=Ajellomyces capsulatus TaxID=5037 RepID=C0NI18_AJECG|nr:uncharacterized protein HCBG_02990 [Histoplasma capsulatum G186AR]EEH09453.1 predicted protein [Histoplasma capsulatum G186AR]